MAPPRAITGQKRTAAQAGLTRSNPEKPQGDSTDRLDQLPKDLFEKIARKVDDDGSPLVSRSLRSLAQTNTSLRQQVLAHQPKYRLLVHQEANAAALVSHRPDLMIKRLVDKGLAPTLKPAHHEGLVAELEGAQVSTTDQADQFNKNARRLTQSLEHFSASHQSRIVDAVLRYSQSVANVEHPHNGSVDLIILALSHLTPEVRSRLVLGTEQILDRGVRHRAIARLADKFHCLTPGDIGAVVKQALATPATWHVLHTLPQQTSGGERFSVLGALAKSIAHVSAAERALIMDSYDTVSAEETFDNQSRAPVTIELARQVKHLRPIERQSLFAPPQPIETLLPEEQTRFIEAISKDIDWLTAAQRNRLVELTLNMNEPDLQSRAIASLLKGAADAESQPPVAATEINLALIRSLNQPDRMGQEGDDLQTIQGRLHAGDHEAILASGELSNSLRANEFTKLLQSQHLSKKAEANAPAQLLSDQQLQQLIDKVLAMPNLKNTSARADGLCGIAAASSRLSPAQMELALKQVSSLRSTEGKLKATEAFAKVIADEKLQKQFVSKALSWPEHVRGHAISALAQGARAPDHKQVKRMLEKVPIGASLKPQSYLTREAVEEGAYKAIAALSQTQHAADPIAWTNDLVQKIIETPHAEVQAKQIIAIASNTELSGEHIAKLVSAGGDFSTVAVSRLLLKAQHLTEAQRNQLMEAVCPATGVNLVLLNSEGVGRWLPELSHEHREQIFLGIRSLQDFEDREVALSAFFSKVLDRLEAPKGSNISDRNLVRPKVDDFKAKNFQPGEIDALVDIACNMPRDAHASYVALIRFARPDVIDSLSVEQMQRVVATAMQLPDHKRADALGWLMNGLSKTQQDSAAFNAIYQDVLAAVANLEPDDRARAGSLKRVEGGQLVPLLASPSH